MTDIRYQIPSRRQSEDPCSLCERPPIRVLRFDTVARGTIRIQLCLAHVDILGSFLEGSGTDYNERKAHTEATDE